MKEIDYIKILKGYIKSLEAEIQKVQVFKVPDFKELPMNCADIDSKSALWINRLQKDGVKDNSPILYYFKITSQHSYQEIQEHVKSYKKKYKKNESGYRALSRVNNLQNIPAADILYVGKSHSAFFSRFKHHLGLYNDDMYSLQLNYWACPIKLRLVMYYSIIDMHKDDLRFLEQMESALHFHFKPILGRSGH